MTSPILLPTGARVRQKSPQPPGLLASRPLPTTKIVVPAKGPPGAQGTPGSGSSVVDVVLAGAQDGVNLVFTTPHTFVAGTVAVYRNGLREVVDIGFTTSAPNTITFTTAPRPDDEIRVDYRI